MISTIINILRQEDYYNVSENVDIAKGKYKIVTSIKEGLKQRKRWQ